MRLTRKCCVRLQPVAEIRFVKENDGSFGTIFLDMLDGMSDMARDKIATEFQPVHELRDRYGTRIREFGIIIRVIQ